MYAAIKMHEGSCVLVAQDNFNLKKTMRILQNNIIIVGNIHVGRQAKCGKRTNSDRQREVHCVIRVVRNRVRDSGRGPEVGSAQQVFYASSYCSHCCCCFELHVLLKYHDFRSSNYDIF